VSVESYMRKCFLLYDFTASPFCSIFTPVFYNVPIVEIQKIVQFNMQKTGATSVIDGYITYIHDTPFVGLESRSYTRSTPLLQICCHALSGHFRNNVYKS